MTKFSWTTIFLTKALMDISSFFAFFIFFGSFIKKVKKMYFCFCFPLLMIARHPPTNIYLPSFPFDLVVETDEKDESDLSVCLVQCPFFSLQRKASSKAWLFTGWFTPSKTLTQNKATQKRLGKFKNNIQ